MDLNITAGMLQKKKLMIATPMYGGQCSGTFTNLRMTSLWHVFVTASKFVSIICLMSR